MTITWRQGVIFGSGLLLGAAAAAWAVLGWQSSSPAPKTQASVPAGQPVPVAARPRTACPLPPLAALAGQGDGQLQMQADLAARTATDIAAFILVGKEAVAAGRHRDAEVAFLMSCRVADRLKGSASIESADARYQLGRHYANIARTSGASAGANRAELLKRAELMYVDSVDAYLARYGEGHEKSQFAAGGLATVRQMSAPAVAVAPTPVPPAAAQAATPRTADPIPAPPPLAKPRPRPAEVAVVSAPVRQATGEATRTRPSFDCGKARSASEKIICSDAELAQLDRELGRLHARAKASTSDAVGFRRQNDFEWRRRESTCRDRECLLDWYANRRDQLMNP